MRLKTIWRGAAAASLAAATLAGATGAFACPECGKGGPTPEEEKAHRERQQGIAARGGGNTSFDVQLDFNNIGATDFFLASFSPAEANVGPTGAGNPDPTLTLAIGTRYRITNVNFTFHPFAVLNKGASAASDLQMLAQGAGAGLFEADAGVDFFDDGSGSIYFNLTTALADAMSSGAGNPGYRCNIHTGSMRGDFVFAPAPAGLVWPGGTDDFEATALGSSIDVAVNGWSVVNGAAGMYEATISDLPAVAAGQVPASSRWLTVTDADATNSNRVYSGAIDAGGDPASYTFSAFINAQAIGAGSAPRVVSQHFNGGGFSNTAGVQFDGMGASVVLVGSDNGGIGAAGADVVVPLYAYADAGGFALGDWVHVSFELDFVAGELRGVAIGSDGATMATATATGLALQGATPDQGMFRFCLRNEGAGNTSTISYDNVSVAGPGPTGVAGWNLY